MSVTLCIPTLTRYDLLVNCIQSAEEGTVKPDRYLIIDNGGTLKLEHNPKIEIYTPEKNLGVAKSWNWLIQNSTDQRIISNDDIFFFPDTIKDLLGGDPSSICCVDSGNINSFSLFTMPDFIINYIGYFDEDISPGWAYFEDNDFDRRLKLAGLRRQLIKTNVGHYGSATLKSLTLQERIDHDRKFVLARENYKAKWGGLPGHELYLTPFNQ